MNFFAKVPGFEGKPLACIKIGPPETKSLGLEGRLEQKITIARAKKAGDSLLKELLTLQESVFGCGRQGRRSEILSTVSSLDRGALFLAFHHLNICGFLLVGRSVAKGVWRVRGIGVASLYRGLGIGTALLGQGINFIRKVQAARLVSYVERGNRPSLNLHYKLGFHIDREARFPASELHVRLVFHPDR